jgi:hypothetical protein
VRLYKCGGPSRRKAFDKITAPMLAQTELARRIRRHVERDLFDDSGVLPAGTAVYSLADPRELRVPRYIGQTASPQRRFLQHLCTARLWLPDERPWWVAQPKLRPLYEWIRELHRDGDRLPTMVIHHWVGTTQAARLLERARIHECLANQLPLLNVERELLGTQIPLI